MLGPFRKQGKGLDINPDQEASYSTQTLQVFEKHIENEWFAKQRRLVIIKSKCLPRNNLFSSIMGAGCGQSSNDPW